MPIRIRPANLESDRTGLIQLFRRFLTDSYNGHKFDWLYQRNPDGRALAWIAYEDGTGEIAGASAAFPRQMHANGAQALGLILGDFCMVEKYRSLGPALKLQRMSLDAVNGQPFELCYDFPSQSMMAIYRRLGLREAGRLQRWAKPFRVNRRIERLVGSSTLSRPISAVANLSLRHRGRSGDPSTCDLTIQDSPCGEEFTVLDQGLRARSGFRTSRTAQFLNWRYLAHPTVKHQILTARREGRLLGYAVTTNLPMDCAIVDLCALDDDVVARLIYGAAEHLRQQGADAVSVYANSGHPWARLFERAGFLQRESSPTVFYSSPSSRIPKPNRHSQWYMMRGERES